MDWDQNERGIVTVNRRYIRVWILLESVDTTVEPDATGESVDATLDSRYYTGSRYYCH